MKMYNSRPPATQDNQQRTPLLPSLRQRSTFNVCCAFVWESCKQQVGLREALRQIPRSFPNPSPHTLESPLGSIFLLKTYRWGVVTSVSRATTDDE